MCIAHPTLWGQSHDPEKQTFQIGGIDYFGYDGVDLKRIEEHLPIHVGDSISFDSFHQEKPLIQRSIEEAIGRRATDIEAVCCNQGNHLHIYIGLPGKSWRPLKLSAAPEANSHLDRAGLNLYRRDEEAVENAVTRGAASEDDSRGYALAEDPGARRVELEMRAYAVDHGNELESVLLQSSDVRQRRASACLLGYAGRSAKQIQSLTEATLDVDGEVRNNAIRALSVLASATDTGGIDVEPAPFIALLYSGQWTDRNKSSFLLMHLSQKRDPALLKRLRTEALAPLIEGARWKDPGHADPFLFILGRIEGIPEAHLEKMIDGGDVSQIIQKAGSLPQAARSGGNGRRERIYSLP